MSYHAGWSGPGRTRLPCADQTACERHANALPPYADDTAFIATSRSPLLVVRYLETYLNRLELWRRDWRIDINVSKDTAVLFAKTTRRVQRSRPPQLFGEQIQWVEGARCLGITLDTRLTWSVPSIINGVPLYRQLICPMMDYACPIWRSAAHTHTNKPQVL
jgi:hypothetical protein